MPTYGPVNAILLLPTAIFVPDAEALFFCVEGKCKLLFIYFCPGK